MKTVYLGLGTNIGNRKENLTRAIEALSLALGPCTAQSSFIDTTEKVERELGRTTKSSGGVYHDRVIDIDILLYGSAIVETPRLTIPHPLMHLRDFVLEPLAEIAPHTIHPKTGKSIEQLKKELGSSKMVKKD